MADAGIALTLTLSQRERGLKASADLRNTTIQPPLPLGEGWGEGDSTRLKPGFNNAAVQVFEIGHAQYPGCVQAAQIAA